MQLIIHPLRSLKNIYIADIIGNNIINDDDEDINDDEDIEQSNTINQQNNNEAEFEYEESVYTQDPLRLKQREFAHRFDLVIVASALSVFAVSRIIVQKLWVDDNVNTFRIVMVIPLLRLFTLIKTTRSAVYIITKVIPRFTSLIFILLLFFYIFAVFGVYLIGDKLKLLETKPQYSFGSSDTIFKILAGIAVIVGSKYAGASMDEKHKETLKTVVNFIFVAAVFGPIKEITHLLHEYLTLSVMFKSDDTQVTIGSNNGICNFECGTFDIKKMKNDITDNISEKLEAGEDVFKGNAKYSAEKTILWNAMWSGFKLLLLAIQQIFAFISAALLLGLGNDIAWFLLIVLLCNLSMILIAFVMCTKFEKLSIGLCCKYYMCCFYNLCPEYCENKWIKLDPIKKKLKFNHLNFIQNNNNDSKTDEKSDESNEGNSIELVTKKIDKDNDNDNDNANNEHEDEDEDEDNHYLIFFFFDF